MGTSRARDLPDAASGGGATTPLSTPDLGIRETTGPAGNIRASRTAWAVLVLVIGAVAVGARAYLLRYARLTGEGTYDDGVHFAGSLALVMGRLPYRDFLFLHPPMILLALAPFAGLAQVTSEGFAFSAARVAWMLLGAFNAIAVARLLRPLGLLSAVVGGLAYALYFPAAYAESTTMLEGLANTFLLASLLLLTRGRSRARLVWAGVLLGLVPEVKIWGIVLVLIVLGWVWVRRGVRPFLAVLLAAAGSCAAVLVPFFAAAPEQMWKMVVAAQLGRPDVTNQPIEARVWEMLGLSGAPPSAPLAWAVATVAVVVAALALWRARAFELTWLAVALLLATVGMLLVTPSFYTHYPAVMAVPFAVTMGSMVTLAPSRGHRLRWAGALALLPVVIAWGMAQDLHDAQSYTGQDIRFTALAGAVDVPGCVTSDDPGPLIELNIFGRNLRRGCPLWIDLTGHYYTDDIGAGLSRPKNPVFQQSAMGYLSGGEVAIVGRQPPLYYLNAANRRIVRGWPVLATSGFYQARRVS